MIRTIGRVLVVCLALGCAGAALALDSGAPKHSHSAKEQSIPCPRCKAENRADARFCTSCGSVLRKDACPKCGATVNAGDKFCAQCGQDLHKAAEQTPAGEKPAEGAAEVPTGGEKQAGEGNPQMQIIGFADINFRATDQPGDNNAFNLGQFDLFITSRLSDKLSVLAENVIEADDKNAFGIEIERLLLQYAVSDYLNIAFGRYHTAIGYYNTAYHHGTWLQTAVNRPFLFQFEDDSGILPIHNVGISLSGRIPSGSAGLQYKFEVGNGRTSRSRADEPVQNVVDENNGKAINFALIARPDALPGFQGGVSVYHDNLQPAGSRNVDELITAFHAVYVTPALEWLNEFVWVQHSPDGAGTTFSTPAFYTQVAKQFGKYRPFFRYQWMNVPMGDPVIGDVGLRHGPSLGVRYDLGEFVALKLQWDRSWMRGLGSFNQLIFQSAFTF